MSRWKLADCVRLVAAQKEITKEKWYGYISQKHVLRGAGFCRPAAETWIISEFESGLVERVVLVLAQTPTVNVDMLKQALDNYRVANSSEMKTVDAQIRFYKIEKMFSKYTNRRW